MNHRIVGMYVSLAGMLVFTLLGNWPAGAACAMAACAYAELRIIAEELGK